MCYVICGRSQRFEKFQRKISAWFWFIILAAIWSFSKLIFGKNKVRGSVAFFCWFTVFCVKEVKWEWEHKRKKKHIYHLEKLEFWGIRTHFRMFCILNSVIHALPFFAHFYSSIFFVFSFNFCNILAIDSSWTSIKGTSTYYVTRFFNFKLFFERFEKKIKISTKFRFFR
jgi:hypothetical protein